MVRVAIALGTLLIVCLPSAAWAQGEKRIALLIGNQSYKPGVGALVNPLNDTRVVGEALKAVGFEVLKPTHNANRAAMLRAIHDFAGKLKGAGSGAVGFLYYSGHGIASLGENYLIPVDVEEPSTVELNVQGVKHSEVLAILRNEAPNAAHYLVLDACRNTLQGARGGKGFVPLGQQSGVLVAFAAEPGKTASDTGQGSGPYAAALAAELVKSGQNDLLMFHNVRVAVMDKTRGDQVPWTEDGIQRRQRVLFGGEIKTAPVAPQAQVNEPERMGQWIKNSNDQALLESVVKTFADTETGALAKARLEELKKRQVAVATPLAPPTVPPKVDVPKPPATRCSGVEVLVGNERRCLKPKDVFKDCRECPEMVVIPAGEFMIGSPQEDKDGLDKERPQHKVTIAKPFAVGKFEVTFLEWDACIAAGGCKYRPEDNSKERKRRPVMVSWQDSKEYTTWLSKATGKPYRLLSEAEWEFAARGVTRVSETHRRYWWGDKASHEYANYGKDSCCMGLKQGRDQWENEAPVGQFPANPFGLHDMHGNMGEFVEDCWHPNYTGAPLDGSAWITPCPARMSRGGHFDYGPKDIRSAERGDPIEPDWRIEGLRVARPLN